MKSLIFGLAFLGLFNYCAFASEQDGPSLSTGIPDALYRTGRSQFHGDTRSMSSILGNLDPVGMWKSASRMVKKGVHVFRESLHDGIKVAQMLRDDVGEGITHILKQPRKPQQEQAQDRWDATTDSATANDAVLGSSEDGMNLQLLREGVIGGLLRFMKVDSNQLGIMALNILIFVAEMISQSLLGKGSNNLPETKEVQADVLKWLISGSNPRVEKLIADAQNHALPENLIETLKDKTGNETACVQLLICKMSPLIWGVQKTLDKQKEGSEGRSSATSNSIIKELFDAMPSKNGFVRFGDECEQRFPTCKLLKYNSKKQTSKSSSATTSSL